MTDTIHTLHINTQCDSVLTATQDTPDFYALDFGLSQRGNLWKVPHSPSSSNAVAVSYTGEVPSGQIFVVLAVFNLGDLTFGFHGEDQTEP